MSHRFPQSTDRAMWGPAQHRAVGVPAIWESLKHLGKYVDLPDAIKASFKMNQKNGFDCPGCAWPDPDDERSSLGEYCENGIKALAEEASSKKVDPDFFKRHSIAELGKWSEFQLGKSGRLTHPMYLPKGGTNYQKISWQEAFERVGQALHELADPNEAVFYTSGRTSNEAAFLYGTMARAFGTNNLPDCSNMCHECSGFGLSKTLGIGKGAVTLADMHEADLILVIGQNPGTNHPRMLNALEQCKKNGGNIIAVNPLKEAGLEHYTNPQSPWSILSGGSSLADLYLQVRINGDIALLKAIMKMLMDRDHNGDIIDHDFINAHTDGYNDFERALSRVDLKDCIEACGIQREEIERAVNMISTSPKMIICWAMGITQHENGVQNVQEIVNLLLLRGAVGKPGAGPCPVRGHSNVQGDRTMGIWEKMPDTFLTQLEKAFEIHVPRKHGYATVPSIRAMYEGRASVFIGMGGNFVSATPDTDYTASALRKCKLTVQISTKLNRSHLVHGEEALILPTLGRSEIDIQSSGYQFVSVENSMGIVHNSKGVLPPKSKHLKSEVAIIAGIADALFKKRDDVNVDWNYFCQDYDRIRDKIEEVIPGFENYNVRVREGQGFYLPNGVKIRKFNTETGKARFTVNPRPNLTLGPGEFILTTIRAHDQYNTTLYGLGDRYRGIKQGREILLIHPKDLLGMGLEAGSLVDVHTIASDQERSVHGFTVVPYDIPRRSVGAYFPEANPLVPIHLVNPETQTPSSKSIKVRLSKTVIPKGK